MSTFTPIPVGNGKYCYSGPNCKRHGVNADKPRFSSVKDVFSRLDKIFPPTVELLIPTTNTDYKKMLDASVGNLTMEEKIAVSEYTSNSGSVTINRALNQDTIPESLKAKIAALDSAIAKFPTSEEHQLFRGSGHVPEGWENLETGDEVETKSFTSTSIHPSEAMRFTDKRSRLLIRILTKEGAPVFSQADESEILLPRNQNYEVVSYSKKTKLNIKTAQVHGSPFNQTFENVNLLTLKSI
jgi:hypothetical protein